MGSNPCYPSTPDGDARPNIPAEHAQFTRPDLVIRYEGAMKRFAVLALLAVSVSVSPVRGSEFLLPEKSPVLAVELPADWEPQEIERGVDARNKDASIHLSIESTRTKEGIKTLVAETVTALEDDGIKIIGDPDAAKPTPRTFLGVDAIDVVFQAKDDAGPITVTLTMFPIKDVNFIITQAVAKDAKKKELALLKTALDGMTLLSGVAEADKKTKLKDAAEQIKNDLRFIDAALDQRMIEFNLKEGATITFDELKMYLKDGTRLKTTGKDPFGNSYPESFKHGDLPLVPATSAAAVGSVTDEAFWKPFKVEGHKKKPTAEATPPAKAPEAKTPDAKKPPADATPAKAPDAKAPAADATAAKAPDAKKPAAAATPTPTPDAKK